MQFLSGIEIKFTFQNRNVWGLLQNLFLHSIKIKSHTSEEYGADLRIFLTFIDALEKQIIIKKLLKWANKNKIILIFTMLHFFKKYKEKHL